MARTDSSVPKRLVQPSRFILALSLILILISHVAAQSNEISYVYNELGRLVAVVDPAGDTAVYTYDAVGNVLSISRFSSSVVSILHFSPNSGPVGTPVTIHGTSFSTSASQNTVTFNGVAATVTSASATQILTSVPVGATTGPVAITTPTGSATSSTPFTVGVSTAPTITSFNPTIGTPGTALTITGTNFETTTSNDWVTFNNRYALVSSATGTAISTSVPNFGTSGRISVATPAGKAISAADFFVPPTPLSTTDVEVTGRMNFGESKTVPISTAGKVGLILFDGTALQRVSLRVNSFSMSTCWVAIYNPDGSILAWTYIYATGAFLDTPLLPATGTYTILIRPEGTNTGSIDFTLYNATDVTGTIVAGGSPVTVTTTTYGQNARLTFVATANQRVSLKVTGVNLTGGTYNWVNVSIKKPDGTTTVSPVLAANGGFIDTQALPLGGVHTILVDPWDTSTGSVTLTLYDVPADVTGTITPGGSSVPVTTTVPGQNSRLSFSGSANDRVSLQVTGLNLTGGTYNWAEVSIKKPDGSTLVSSTLGGSGFLDSQTLPVSGTYTVVVDPWDTSIGSATLRLYTVPTDVTATITAGGSAVTVTTTVAGQNSQLSFSGLANERVSLRVTGLNLTGGTYNWASVSIKRPDGSTMVSSTLSGSGFFDTQILPVTGTYSILVDPWDASIGSATLTLYAVPADAGGPITPGGSAVTVTNTVPGQNGQLSFSGSANQRVSLQVTGVNLTGGSLNVAILSIKKPDGSTLVSGFVGGNDFFDTQVLPVAGTYIILVDLWDTATGSLTLTLHDVPADATDTATVGGSAVTVTTTVPGQNANVTFSGTAAQQIAVNFTNNSMGTVTVKVFKPDGSQLTSTVSNSSSFNLELQTLPSTGTYTLGIDSSGTTTGSLTVTINNAP